MGPNPVLSMQTIHEYHSRSCLIAQATSFAACHRAAELTLRPVPHQHLAGRRRALDIENL